MKDSGIDWIGKIPEEWIVSKAKTILHNKTVKNHPNAEVLSLYRDLGVVPKNSRDDNHNVTSEDTSSYKFVQKGELVLNKMKTWQGSLAVSNYEGIVSPAYYVCEFTNNEIDKNYIHYLLRNKMYAQEFERLSTGLRVGQWDLSIDDFLNTLIIYPPTKAEQTKIARFLDKKCAQIDSIIEESKKSIEEYKSWKQSMIFEAVTGKNNRKKWKQEKLKYLADYNIESLSEETNGDFNFDYIDIGSVKFGEGIISKENMNFKVAPSRARRIVKEGDVIISSVRTYLRAIAKIEKSDVPQIVSTGFVVFTPKKEKITSDFLYYAISSENLIEQVESNSVGISYPAINAIDIVNFKIPLPSIKEQEEIVIEIDAKCAQIDSLISEKQSLIKDLAEYKKSLIFEAVTGKRRV